MNGGRKLKRNIMLPLKTVGFVVPLIIVMFGATMQFFYPDKNPQEIIKFAVISVIWVVLATAQLSKKNNPKLVIIAYHLLATVSILLVYPIMAPFISFWILLSLAAFVRYGQFGLIMSLLWLLFTLTVSSILRLGNNATIFAYEFATVVAVISASYVIFMLSSSQEQARDALHKSRARESLQRNRLLSIINNQSDGIISVDKRGFIRVFNSASMWLLDTNKDLIGQKINHVFPLYNLDREKVDIFKELTSAKTSLTRDDLLFKTGEGEMLRFEVTFAPIRHAYGKKEIQKSNDDYIIIFRDITSKKNLDEEKNEFISVVSHELRTPITVAEGALSNAQLLYDSPRAPRSAVKKAIAMGHDQVLFLANMINDLSTLSRAQRDIMAEPEIISVKELGYQTLDRYSGEAKRKGLILDLDMSARLGSVFTSRLYLEELMQNLVLNAIKYTPSGRVTIKLTRKGDEIQFAVIDTGIGISRSEREKIFEKFYRSEDFRTRETSGTGLGLFLSAQLADKMGAWLKLTSRVNHGSTFYFELPVYDQKDESELV